MVPVGEASIVIAVSSPHRKEALSIFHFSLYLSNVISVVSFVPSQKKGDIHLLFLIVYVKCDVSVVPVGEASIVITVSSPHRNEALSTLILTVCVKCDFSVVPVGEASIVIAVSSPHRKEALSTLTVCVKCDFSVVPVGEASIVIAVSSPHRKEALEAVHFAIDHVKATVPVWKKVSLLLPLLSFSFRIYMLK